MKITHGIIFLGFLTLLLAEAKITGLLALPWAIVLAPLWVPVAFVALVVNLFATGCYLVINILKALATHGESRPPKSAVALAHHKIKAA